MGPRGGWEQIEKSKHVCGAWEAGCVFQSAAHGGQGFAGPCRLDGDTRTAAERLINDAGSLPSLVMTFVPRPPISLT